MLQLKKEVVDVFGDEEPGLDPAPDTLDERILKVQDEDVGPYKAMDPEVAMARRAVNRARQQEAARQHVDVGDTLLPEDIMQAEERFDPPEEDENDMGYPMEPFNLRQEREEGFFDPEGNYIPFRREEEPDAWLDSLEGGNAKDAVRPHDVDTQQGGGGDGEDADDDQAAQATEPDPLGPEAIGALCQRIVQLLQPRETPLDALRRLGRSSSGLANAAPGPGRGPNKRQRQESAREQQQLTEPHLHISAPSSSGKPTSVPIPHAPVSSGNTDAADGEHTVNISSTSAATATEHMDVEGTTQGITTEHQDLHKTDAHPDQDQHQDQHESHQQLQQHVHHRLLPGMTGPNAPVAVNPAGLADAVLEADPLRDVHGRGGCAGTKPAARSRHVVPPENSVAFNELTECADMLLQNGSYNIYSTCREALLAKVRQNMKPITQATAVASTDCGRQQTPAGISIAAHDVNTIAHGSNERLAVKANKNRGAVSSTRHAFPTHPELVERALAAATTDRTASTSTAMTSNGVAQQQQASAAAMPTTAAPADVVARAETATGSATTGTHSIGQSADMSNSACTAALTYAANTNEEDTSGGFAADSTAQVQDGSLGFTYDATSGLYRNDALGYLYDPASRLFQDFATGLWYAYNNGQYELAPL